MLFIIVNKWFYYNVIVIVVNKWCYCYYCKKNDVIGIIVMLLL